MDKEGQRLPIFYSFKKQLSSNVILEKSFEQLCLLSKCSVVEKLTRAVARSAGLPARLQTGILAPDFLGTGLWVSHLPLACDFLHVMSE